MRRHSDSTQGDSTQNAAKFSLYLKLREIKTIGTALQQVMLLPPEEREQWIEHYGEFMHEAFNDFMTDSTEALDELSFDEEMVDLSEDLIMSLQDMFNMVQGILSKQPKLKG